MERPPARGLSQAALETLAIVAYLSPVSRPEIARIRGVASDSAVANLLERGLIEDAGRADTPGNPVVYRTTTVFRRTFGLEDDEALPAAHAVRADRVRSPGAARPAAPGRRPACRSGLTATWRPPGSGSRRAVDELIRAGRVTVNGEVGELGAAVGDGDVVARRRQSGRAAGARAT